MSAEAKTIEARLAEAKLHDVCGHCLKPRGHHAAEPTPDECPFWLSPCQSNAEWFRDTVQKGVVDNLRDFLRHGGSFAHATVAHALAISLSEITRER